LILIDFSQKAFYAYCIQFFVFCNDYYTFLYKEDFVKNYLKVSLLCISSLTLYGSEYRKSGDKPTKSASFAGSPNPKIVEKNPLTKSTPIPIQKERVVVDLGWKAKRASQGQGFSAGDYYLGFGGEQSCSPSPRDYNSTR